MRPDTPRNAATPNDGNVEIHQIPDGIPTSHRPANRSATSDSATSGSATSGSATSGSATSGSPASHRADNMMRRWRLSATAVLGLALLGGVIATAIAHDGGTDAGTPKMVAAAKTTTAAKTAIAATAPKAAKPAAAPHKDWVFPMDGRVTSCPGPRWGSTHQGIDVGDAAAKGGSTIRAAAAGRVVQAGFNNGGYGNMVIIRHAGGTHTLYGHAAKVLVKAGQSVKAGQRIALEGSTGHSTGPHLHFEVQKAVWHRINPVTFLENHGLDVKC